MSYRYLEYAAIADVAFEAEGATIGELFQEAAAAMTNTMIKDLETLGESVGKGFDLEAPDIEMLLYRFLQELIFYKDAERLLFKRFELDIVQGSPAWRLSVQAYGEELDSNKHELLADVKAVSFHNFSVRQTSIGWEADVVIDV